MVYLFSSSSYQPRGAPHDSEQDFDRLATLLKWFNLLELKQELEQPILPITSLSNLCQQTDSTLQVLEVAFAQVSDSCSHWTINSLFGSNVLASYLEKLVHHQFNPFAQPATRKQQAIRQFSHSLVSELTVSLALNYLSLLSSLNPLLTSVGIISAAVAETLIQSALNLVSVQSFSIVTELIRQRLREYSEFKDFLPEYQLYTHFFQRHHYRPVYQLQIINFPDHLQIFKLIHTFAGVTNRGNLLQQLILVLEKDPIFQARLKVKLAQGGVMVWKLVSILADTKFSATKPQGKTKGSNKH